MRSPPLPTYKGRARRGEVVPDIPHTEREREGGTSSIVRQASGGREGALHHACVACDMLRRMDGSEDDGFGGIFEGPIRFQNPLGILPWTGVDKPLSSMQQRARVSHFMLGRPGTSHGLGRRWDVPGPRRTSPRVPGPRHGTSRRVPGPWDVPGPLRDPTLGRPGTSQNTHKPSRWGLF